MALDLLAFAVSGLLDCTPTAIVVKHGARGRKEFRWAVRHVVLYRSSGRPGERGWVPGCRAPRA
eukprot:14322019-Alexandrium_andersonii.AAC.1